MIPIQRQTLGTLASMVEREPRMAHHGCPVGCGMWQLYPDN